MTCHRFLLIASYASSLMGFRGPLIAALQRSGLQVHVAVTDLLSGATLRKQPKSLGVITHDIPLQRAGMHSLANLVSLWALCRLIRRVQARHKIAHISRSYETVFERVVAK